jgi:multimeric flavodoxin WrbA
MKIIGICGSMRKKSNSEWMVRKVLDSARSEGVSTDLVLLRDLNIEYCNGCDSCFRNGGGCVIDDDMQDIYPRLLEADVIVLGTPNYFRNVSALTKNFMDRTNALIKGEPGSLQGKYAIGLCVGGQPLEDTQHCERVLINFFRSHKMKILCTVKARADEPNSISEDRELEKQLTGIGKKIAVKNMDDVTSFR